MRFRITIVTVAVAVCLVATLLLAPARPAAASTGSTAVSGTFYGAFDYAFEGKGAWVGYAVFQFGDRSPAMASFVDRNTSYAEGKNGVAKGTETISVTLLDGSGTFELNARFMGIPGATPSLYNLSETSTFANGTGQYAGISGQLTTHGPYLYPNPAITPGAPLWIGEAHGVALGLE
jgi:hypothetical protein